MYSGTLASLLHCVVHIRWLVISQAHFPQEMSIFLSSVSFFLRCLCLSDHSVLELWQFLIYFQAGGPSWSSPFSGFWTRFSGKLWRNLAKSGFFLWAIGWRERIETLCSPSLTPRAHRAWNESVRRHVPGPPIQRGGALGLLRKPGTRGSICSSSEFLLHALPSEILCTHTSLFPLGWRVL